MHGSVTHIRDVSPGTIEPTGSYPVLLFLPVPLPPSPRSTYRPGIRRPYRGFRLARNPSRTRLTRVTLFNFATLSPHYFTFSWWKGNPLLRYFSKPTYLFLSVSGVGQSRKPSRLVIRLFINEMPLVETSVRVLSVYVRNFHRCLRGNKGIRTINRYYRLNFFDVRIMYLRILNLCIYSYKFHAYSN